MSNLEVIRIPEDPPVPKGVAKKVFRQAARDPQSVLVVAWSPYRWKTARDLHAPGQRIRVLETDRARWSIPERYEFAGELATYLPGVSLLVVADDFVILPPGMPGGHSFGPTAAYCPICKLWRDGEGAGC